jgi:hypothetical protein
MHSSNIKYLNSLCILESVNNAKHFFFLLPLLLKTQHVSALDGHLQVSQYVETTTCINVR